ncbi:MAG: hypothetical protein L3K19_07780, partial [Thermoplasmata archaeon]|nr:hypothetical protein [Thermoplasmata archaeon]
RRQIRDLVVRMHRGSSKDARPHEPASEILPLSASPPGTISVVFDFERAGSTNRRTVELACGIPLRVALRQLGQAAEGCAVLEGGRSLPLDTPLERSTRLTVLPTFSGG